MARAYYNENNLAAAAVLEQQIADGVIAPGIVDTRSIKDVQPDDLRGFVQCHFFAGGGLWSVAARLAGWPDWRPIWTGSCPCQPFSAAGRGLGTDDPRHLWPDFLRLIRGAGAAGFGPPVIMGEQVSGSAGYGWLDGVRADLAEEGYASRARDIPALAVDAPHERNRLYWIAVADCDGSGHPGRQEDKKRDEIGRDAPQWSDVHLVDVPSLGRGEGRTEPELWGGRPAIAGTDAPDRRNGSFWSDAEWITGHDGKARRTKPGLPFLVDGASIPLAAIRSECLAEAQKRIIAHGWPRDCRGFAEALSVVWLRDVAQAISSEQFIGVRGELPKETFLHDFVCDALAACECQQNAGLVSKTSPDRDWAYLRSLLDGSAVTCSPREWGSHRQSGPQSADALRELSRFLARLAETCWKVTGAADAKAFLTFTNGRVDLWRIAGNAIVPILAAEVIGAFLDAEEAA